MGRPMHGDVLQGTFTHPSSLLWKHITTLPLSLPENSSFLWFQSRITFWDQTAESSLVREVAESSPSCCRCPVFPLCTFSRRGVPLRALSSDRRAIIWLEPVSPWPQVHHLKTTPQALPSFLLHPLQSKSHHSNFIAPGGYLPTLVIVLSAAFGKTQTGTALRQKYFFWLFF